MKSIVGILLLLSLFFVSCSDNPNSPVGGTIKGKVLDMQTQKPLANVSITTKPPTESIFTDENGVYEITDLDEGEYTVIAQKNNYLTGEVTVTVRNGKITEANLMLTDTINGHFGKVEGKVIDAKTDNPIEGVYIKITPISLTTITDKEGKFKIDLVPAGDYSLICKKENYRTEITNIRVVADETSNVLVSMHDRVSSNNPPEKPILLKPVNGGTVYGNEVTLTWKCSDPDNDELLYDVYLSTNNPPDKRIAENINEKTFTFYSDKEYGQFYWKVIAKDGVSGISESDISMFKVENESGEWPQKGLLAYYPFNGNANDEGPNKYNGVNHGAVPGPDRFNRDNSSYFFGDGQEYIELPEPHEFAFSGDFTIACWIKPDLNSCIPKFTHIDVINKTNLQDNGWYLGFTTDLGPEFWVNNTFIGYDLKKLSNLQWNHIAIVFRKNAYNSTGLATLYLNGLQLGDSKRISAPTNEFNNLRIGDRPDNTSFGGWLDDVYFYNRALSETEIQKLMMRKQ